MHSLKNRTLKEKIFIRPSRFGKVINCEYGYQVYNMKIILASSATNNREKQHVDENLQ